MEVAEREHGAAGPRHALDAVVAERHEQPDERLQRQAADRPDGVDAHVAVRSRTIPSMRLDDVVLPSSVVSICTASGAGLMLTASRSSRIRRSVASASAGDFRPLGGASLRADGRIGHEVHLDEGARGDDRTDVAALDDDVPSSPSWRCRSRMTSRTAGWRATTGTSWSIPGFRIEEVTSASSM